jgi:hypothetical protein
MNVPQCRHVKTDGARCGCPAVRAHHFCHWHAQMRAHERRHSSAEARALPLQLPPLEDAHSIQLALMEVGRALLEDRISDKKAGLLLYMLQTAGSNVKRLQEDRSEQLVRQDYPEALEEMQRLKREEARDPEEKRQESLAEILLKGLGIHPDQPPPKIVPPDETPTWWEIEAGYKQPLPGQVTNPPQRTQRDTEETKNDSACEVTDEMKIPFLSQRVEDIRGMAADK